MRLKSRIRGKRRLAVVGLSLTLGALSLAAIALADNVQINDLDTSGDAVKAPGDTGTATIRMVGNAANGDIGGCNVDASHPATVTITSNQPWVIVDSPGSVTITDCVPNGAQTIGYSVAAAAPDAGVATVSTSTSGGKTGAKYNDDSFTVTVAAPVVTNHQPTVVSPGAADADGTEGDTLSTSGAFSDSDIGDSLTLTADNGTVGTFTPNNSAGTWSWSLGTNDDVAGGTITVTATDTHGATATDSFHYSAANANPTIANLAFTGTNCDPTLGFNVNDVGTADTETGTILWGDTTSDSFGPINAGGSVSQSHHYGSAGSKTITVKAQDDDLGAATDATTSYTVNNIPSDILQPINYTGPRSAFKGGSTIPVKIQVTDCDGNYVSTLAPQVAVYKINVPPDPDGTTSEALSTVPPSSGTTMRYDATGAQYIYNLATKGLTVPSDYKVVVSDPSFAADKIAYITLKK